MRHWLNGRRPSASLVISIIALCVALGGGSFAVAALGGHDKKVVKKLARHQANKQIKKKAPRLSVRYADSADSATSADRATRANQADSATRAGFADGASLADMATDATKLGNVPAGAYQLKLEWAVVAADSSGASVARGNASGAGRLAAGAYYVRFAPQRGAGIRNCAYLATDGSVASQLSHPGEISVEQFSSTNSTDIEVRHYDSAGSQTDFPAGGGFHIAVLCP